MLRPSDEDRARKAMVFYRGMGFNPVPSRDDKKAPRVPFAEHWTTVGPDWWIDVRTRNVQVMTGAAWRLMVVDLDGPMAIEVFRSWSMFRDLPPTWESAHTPEAGRHLWYRLPPGASECPSRFVWRLEGAKHAAVEILGDRKLVVAPPSIHVKTGHRYRWLPNRSPRTIRLPAFAPGWLLALPDISPPRDSPILSPITRPSTQYLTRVDRCGTRYRTDDVLAAIPDIRAMGETMGLHIVGNANANGWIPCHAFNRDDRTPSAGFNVRTGYYCEPHVVHLSLFELAVEVGLYATWRDARDDMGRRFNAKPMEGHP